MSARGGWGSLCRVPDDCSVVVPLFSRARAGQSGFPGFSIFLQMCVYHGFYDSGR